MQPVVLVPELVPDMLTKDAVKKSAQNAIFFIVKELKALGKSDRSRIKVL